MKRIVKITPSQYKMLLEANEASFSYLSPEDDTKPFDALKTISTNGKTDDGEKNSGTNVTSDEIQKIRTREHPYYARLGNMSPPSHLTHLLREQGEQNQANNFGEVDSIDNQYLDNQEQIVKIPQDIRYRINLLLKSIQTKNLQPNQYDVILSSILKNIKNTGRYPVEKGFNKIIRKLRQQTNSTYSAEKENENNA